jgi:proline dehydrogenase
MLFRSLILRVSSWKWFERFVSRSKVMKRVVQRFIAGEKIADAIKIAEQLCDQGFYVTLDLLGEHSDQPSSGDAAVEEYKNLVHTIAASPYSGGQRPENINISIKLTQLGLLDDYETCLRRFKSLLATTSESGNFVRVDMEDSSCTEKTLSAVKAAFAEHGNVGVAIQSMLYRSEDDISSLNSIEIRVRLVKGAYLEPSEVARKDRESVDSAYISMAETLLENGVYPAFGTHDDRIISKIKDYAKKKGIDSSRFEFQMLYGIRRALQSDLAKSGYNVRIYVPYGTSWYPYFTRRLAERPSNLLFFIRSLFGK